MPWAGAAASSSERACANWRWRSSRLKATSKRSPLPNPTPRARSRNCAAGCRSGRSDLPIDDRNRGCAGPPDALLPNECCCPPARRHRASHARWQWAEPRLAAYIFRSQACKTPAPTKIAPRRRGGSRRRGPHAPPTWGPPRRGALEFGAPGAAFLAVRKHHSIYGLTQETPPRGRYRRMALDEEQSNATCEMPQAIDWLRDCADLAGVDLLSLESLAAGAVHFSLPAGYLLFEAGSDPNGVYLLASGRLGVKTPLKPGLTAEIERGELVRQAGWLLETPRSATVVALRDSELLLIPNAEMERVAARSTHLSLALARLCARRLRHSNRQEYRPKRAHIFALVPNGIELDVADLAARWGDDM